jgi:DNA-binding LytR/AlgR family response regulator
MPDHQINILVVEDEAVLAMDLSDLLEDEGYCVVGTANNGRKALSLYQQNRVDLLLCDISIKSDWDGIETAEYLQAERPVPVVFLTALTDKETLGRALQTQPAAYLVKPATLAGLRAAIELALRQFTNPAVGGANPPAALPVTLPKDGAGQETILQIDDYVFIKHNYQFVKIRLDDIEWLEADSAYTTVVTPTHRYALRLTIGHMLERLNYGRLVRIHRSYAVNLNRVSTFNEHEVTVRTQTLPLSRLYKPDFLRHFQLR